MNKVYSCLEWRKQNLIPKLLNNNDHRRKSTEWNALFNSTYMVLLMLVSFGVSVQATSDVNLAHMTNKDGFRMKGRTSSDLLGFSVSDVGDVNGDNSTDIIVGSYGFDLVPPGRVDCGIAYVLFGHKPPYVFNDQLLPNMTTGPTTGFRIIGAKVGDSLGYSVSGAGDVNGDSFDDIIIGTIYGDYFDRTDNGVAYVIFGRLTFTADIDLSTWTPGQYTEYPIIGAGRSDQLGIAVSRAGDINGDGLNDVIVGANWVDYNGQLDVGAAYVIFGTKAVVTEVDVATWTASSTDGFIVYGIQQNDETGKTVCAAGDINGDGIDDVLLSALGSDMFNGIDSGTVYVIFGRRTPFPAVLNLNAWSTSAENGFRLFGSIGGAWTGVSMSGRGDINGDGIADVVIGATNRYGSVPGAAYVIFGHNVTATKVPFTDIDLLPFTASATTGFRIFGLSPGSLTGWGVSNAGDLNGDGYSDVIVSAPNANAPPDVAAAGQVFVIYGRNTSIADINLEYFETSPSTGYRIFGAGSLDYAGYCVSGAGDFNGDGLVDILIGAPDVVVSGQARVGVAYVVYSVPDSPTSQPSSQPSQQPTSQPTLQPNARPSTQPSVQPSSIPSSQSSQQPTTMPSCQPSSQPSQQPTQQPTSQPSQVPTMQPSRQPSSRPSSQPSTQPSCQPSPQPSSQPTTFPSTQPSTQPSAQPSRQPVALPSSQPLQQPTSRPTVQPSEQPTAIPSSQPTTCPSTQPTAQPSEQPSSQPSLKPTTQPSVQPSIQPSAVPSMQPSCSPTAQPTSVPSTQPSSAPSSQPSVTPTSQPSVRPSTQPTVCPSVQPSSAPTTVPTSQPTEDPSSHPTDLPSTQPSAQPSTQPSSMPTMQPRTQPTVRPSAQPSCQPSVSPSAQPSTQPTKQLSSQPSTQPTTIPSAIPSSQPSRQPSTKPTTQPSAQPSLQPSTQPTAVPTHAPPTGEYAVVMSKVAHVKSISAVQDTVWACSDRTVIGAYTVCTVVDAWTGETAAQYNFPWDGVTDVFPTTGSTSNNKIIVSGHTSTVSTTSNSIVSSNIAMCNTEYARLTCTVKSVSDVYITAASNNIFAQKVVYVGMYSTYTTAVIMDSSGAVKSYIYTNSFLKSITLSAVQSIPNFVGSFVAGVCTSKTAVTQNYIYAGWLRCDIGSISAFYITATSSTIQNSVGLVSGLAVEATGPDSFIVGGLQLTDTAMCAYIIRVNTLFKEIKYGVRYIHNASSDGSRRRLAVTNTTFSASKGVVLMNSVLFMIVQYVVHNSTQLVILKTAPTTGEIIKQVSIYAHNGSVYCTDIVATPPTLTIACTIHAHNSIVKSILLAVDTALTVAALPVLLHKHYDTVLQAETLALRLTPLSMTTTSTTLMVSSTTYDSSAHTNPVPQPTVAPSTAVLSALPSAQPSSAPSTQPSSSPTTTPTVSARPTSQPSSAVPTISHKPSNVPTEVPTLKPTTTPTIKPSYAPTVQSSVGPTVIPTTHPTATTSATPSIIPTRIPSFRPTHKPTRVPSALYTHGPTIQNTVVSDVDSTSRRSNTVPPYIIGTTVGGVCIILCCVALYKYNQHKVAKKDRAMRKAEFFARQAMEVAALHAEERAVIAVEELRLEKLAHKRARKAQMAMHRMHGSGAHGMSPHIARLVLPNSEEIAVCGINNSDVDCHRSDIQAEGTSGNSSDGSDCDDNTYSSSDSTTTSSDGDQQDDDNGKEGSEQGSEQKSDEVDTVEEEEEEEQGSKGSVSSRDEEDNSSYDSAISNSIDSK